MDPVVATIIAVLGIATGIFGSHATLGKQITRALALIERGVADITELQADVKRLEAKIGHRRETDE